MPLYMKMSQNINKTTRHLKFLVVLYIYIYIYIYIYKIYTYTHTVSFSIGSAQWLLINDDMYVFMYVLFFYLACT